MTFMMDKYGCPCEDIKKMYQEDIAQHLNNSVQGGKRNMVY